MNLNKELLVKNCLNIKLDENGQPEIYRFGKVSRNSTPSLHRVYPPTSTKNHPYGKDKKYQNFTLFINGKKTTMQVSRVVYAWFKGEVPEYMQVDHIDDNGLNNNPNNLQLLTRLENWKKRKAQRQINKDWRKRKNEILDGSHKSAK